MLIISKSDNQILNLLRLFFEQEKLEYECVKSIEGKKDKKIIYINDDIEEIPENIESDILVISSKKEYLKRFNHLSNLIITSLVSDNNEYTKTQEEYMYRKGIYSVINKITLDFINGRTIDKVTYDITNCKLRPNDWIFDFESIAETYAWLSKMNRREKELKVMDLATPDTYNTFNDSDKEINYLTEYIALARRELKISTIFIVTKDLIKEKMKNRFFDILARKCGDNVKTYFCDIAVLEKKEPEILNRIRDGINIYSDCVYRDNYSSEISLGSVDCKLESVKEYNELFNYIKDNYSVSLVEGGEYNAI